MDRLNELVEKANTGAIALEAILGDFEGKVEVFASGDWEPVENYIPMGIRFREAPKSVMVGKWNAVLDKNTVTIGCFKFNAKQLLVALQNIDTRPIVKGHPVELKSAYLSWRGQNISFEDAAELQLMLDRFF